MKETSAHILIPYERSMHLAYVAPKPRSA